MTDLIKTETKDRILVITLNRPDKKNALTHAMYTAIADALAAAREDENTRVIVFQANGDAFTAGNDLIDFQKAGGLEGAQPVLRFLNELLISEKPIIAAVNGIAVGVGLTMLLHCDLVYMAKGAELQAPFVDLALVPEAASSLLLPARIGHVRSAEVFMLGKRVSAEEACAWGLANTVCAPEKLEAVAYKAALALSKKAPKSVQTAKRLMRGDKSVIEARMQEESRYFSDQLKSAEFAEAVTAFLQKRAPDFQ
ncbi:enoyl-CoA hydratase-related protein [Kordiimonas pumila]|uniref:Enoyl-CoA hydratase-related protein n=1 Tax=Kordiimonas pumila TaxID=2161677 RepID=A0ABV7DAC9_9PROT|nr:enoyl-CoA hydratase-related protein [Kordiimonas pumila]